MKIILGLICVVILGVANVGLVSQSQAQQNAPGGFFPYNDAARVAHGQEIYTEYCAACHGDDLQGEPDWQTRDADGFMPAPPHDQTGHTWHHSEQQLFMNVKYGTEMLVGGNYQSRMGGYGDVLEDGAILDVLAYIKSTWPASLIERHNQIGSN